MTNLLTIRQRNNPVDAHNAGSLFARFIAPLHNNISDWLKLTAEGRLEDAYELKAQTTCQKCVVGCPQDSYAKETV